MTTLIHGTTRFRAELILKNGPNPGFIEPGGSRTYEGFSSYIESGPFLLEPPEDYALGKNALFPNEGGPVILVIENVPDSVLEAANPDGLYPPEYGLVQFDLGAGLEELLAVWPKLNISIRDV
jgi:hypothetical protein